MKPCKAMVTESPPPNNRKRILVIEDDFPVRMMLVRFLESNGYEVFQEDTGSNGYQKALDLRPDLIIMDLNLPGMNGTEICEKIKADTRIKDIPVIMMTGNFKEVKDKVKGFHLGADDYFLKPLDIAVLAARVKTLLKQAPRE